MFMDFLADSKETLLISAFCFIRNKKRCTYTTKKTERRRETLSVIPVIQILKQVREVLFVGMRH